MTIAGLFSVLTFQVKNLQLRFVIGLYKIEHIIRRGNHLYGNPVNQDLVRFFSKSILFRNFLPCVETKLRRGVRGPAFVPAPEDFEK